MRNVPKPKPPNFWVEKAEKQIEKLREQVREEIKTWQNDREEWLPELLETLNELNDKIEFNRVLIVRQTQYK